MRVVSVGVRVETGVLDGIVYTLEHGGVTYYRVVKLIRLLRSPREYAQIETALEIHRDFVSSTRELPSARLVLLACNSRRVRPDLVLRGSGHWPRLGRGRGAR